MLTGTRGRSTIRGPGPGRLVSLCRKSLQVPTCTLGPIRFTLGGVLKIES